jgi:hypothetical protein
MAFGRAGLELFHEKSEAQKNVEAADEPVS